MNRMHMRSIVWLLTIGICIGPVVWSTHAGIPTPSLTLQPQGDVWSDSAAAVEPSSPETPIASQLAPWAYDPMIRHLSAFDSTDVRYEIVINLPALRLFLYDRGRLINDYPIAIGDVVSQSLLGTTRIINKVSNPTYYPPNWAARGLKPIPPGPDNPVGTFWLGLEWKGYGIHGTNNPASIGTAQSAGCIRMYNADVEALGRIVPINTPVTIVYEPVVVWRDADQPYIAVYPDVYRIGLPTDVEISGRVREIGISTPVHSGALAYLLHTASGEPTLLPLQTTVRIGSLPLIDGYYQGENVFVSLTALSDQLQLPLQASPTGEVTLGEMRISDAWTWEHLAFGKLDAVLTLTLGAVR